MFKFAHLLVLSTLIFWLAGSGCVGNGTSEIEKSAVDPNIEADNGAPAEDLEMGLMQAEIQELDSDMADLQGLLEDASPKEKIEIEEL